MDFRDSPEEAAFRKEVRAFLQQELTPDLRQPDEAILGVGTSEIQRNIIATRGLGLPRG